MRKQTTFRDWLAAGGYLILRGFVYLLDKRDMYRISVGKDPILPR